LGPLGGFSHHSASDCEGDAPVHLVGDVDFKALELRALLDDIPEGLDGASPVAVDFRPDGQANVADGVSMCECGWLSGMR